MGGMFWPGNPSTSEPAWRWQHWPVVPRCRGSEDVKVTDILLAAAAVSVRLMVYLVTTLLPLLVIDTLCSVTVTLVTCTLTLAPNHREQFG